MITEHPMYLQCLDIATKAHLGQPDKADAPYIHHPVTVSRFVEVHDHPFLKPLGEALTKEQLLQACCVALLHDVVEDTPVTIDDLRDVHHVPLEICDAVLLLTKDKTMTDLWPYYRALKLNPLSRIVKLADLIHNSDLSRLPAITPSDLERTEAYRNYIAYLRQD